MAHWKASVPGPTLPLASIFQPRLPPRTTQPSGIASKGGLANGQAMLIQVANHLAEQPPESETQSSPSKIGTGKARCMCMALHQSRPNICRCPSSKSPVSRQADAFRQGSGPKFRTFRDQNVQSLPEKATIQASHKSPESAVYEKITEPSADLGMTQEHVPKACWRSSDVTLPWALPGSR